MMARTVALTTTDLTIDSADRQLAARRIGGGVNAPGVLFLHGLHSDKTGYQPRAEAVASRLGAVCLIVDLGGHGASTGVREDLSPRDNLVDAAAAYDALIGSGEVDPNRVGVCGASYGGYLASLLVQQRAVRKLFLRAPALYADRWLDAPLRDRGPLEETPQASAAQESLGAFDGGVFVLEGGDDKAIPSTMVQAYVRAGQRVRHEVIPGATHRLTEPAWEATFVGFLLEWFSDL